MILLDAYALVALLADEPAADEVEELLRGEEEIGVTLFNLAEAVDVTQRVHGLATGAVRGALEPLIGHRIAPLVPTERDAWRAAELRVRHYDRRHRALSLADCFLLAAAEHGARIATADPPLADVARGEGVPVVAIPDSVGKRP